MDAVSEVAPKLLHECELAVRWGDMDAYGHVNNAMYLRFLEEARCQMLAAMDVELETQQIAPVVINVGCTFLRPVVYPDTLTIRCYGAEPGRSSFMSSYEVLSHSQQGQKVSEGYAKLVWMDHHTGKSVPLPEYVRAQLVS